MKVRRRKKRSGSPPERDKRAQDLEGFLNHGRRQPRNERKLSVLEQAVADAEHRSRTGDWDGAPGRSLVGLYAVCHRIVYGLLPQDLADRGMMNRASRQATRCLREHFHDDAAELVEFVKWTWDREKGREKWAEREGVSRNRLGVGLQFSAKLVTDYRVDLQRRRRRRG